MDCLECRYLEQALKSDLGKYIEARSAAYYRVCTKLAAIRNVDMERAKNALEEHLLVCVSAAEVTRRCNNPDFDVHRCGPQKAGP